MFNACLRMELALHQRHRAYNTTDLASACQTKRDFARKIWFSFVERWMPGQFAGDSACGAPTNGCHAKMSSYCRKVFVAKSGSVALVSQSVVEGAFHLLGEI